MKSNYKRLGDFIVEIDDKNVENKKLELYGVSIDKKFIKSVANIIGTDLSKYKLVTENSFVCSLMQVSRDEKIPIALWQNNEIIVSPAYKVFKVRDKNILSEYLNLWFKRSEFDRETSFYAVGGVRGSLDWNDFCDMKVPIPDINEQQKIVDAYNAIENRIAIKQKINEKLEELGKMFYLKSIQENNYYNKNITDICNIKYGKNFCLDNLKNKGYFVYGSNGIIGYSDKYLYENEQIIISCRGESSGAVNISLPYSFITNNSLILECNCQQEYQFLKWFCLTYTLKKYVTGSAQPQLTINNLSTVEVSLPLNESDKYHEMLDKLSKCIENNTLQIIKLFAIKNTFLKNFLNYIK